MAIVFLDQTRCALCNDVIQSGDAFAHFTDNAADPLHAFSDAAVHTSCLRAYEACEMLESRLADWSANNGPGNRACRSCGQQVMHPGQHVSLGFLTADTAERLHEFNYAQLHRACFASWIHTVPARCL